MAEPNDATTKAPIPRPHGGAWTGAFLAALQNSANVRAACLAAKVTRQAAYQWRETHPKFRAAWEVALEDACDLLEAEARTRARAGSDLLLIFLLKAHRPAVYRERYEVIMVQKEAARISAERGLEPSKLLDFAKKLAERTG